MVFTAQPNQLLTLRAAWDIGALAFLPLGRFYPGLDRLRISPNARVAVNEAKTHLIKLIPRVEAGGRIVIKRRGKPITDLVPHRPRGDLAFDRLDAIQRELAFLRLR